MFLTGGKKETNRNIKTDIIMKILYYDLETTGLDHKQHAPIQFAGLLEIDGQLEMELNYTMKPYPDDLIDRRALEVNGRTMEEIQTFDDPTEVLGWILERLGAHVNIRDRSDQIFLCGYNNIHFDDQFMREWFIKARRPQYDFMNHFWNESLDMRVLCAAALARERKDMPNFKLVTVARHFGIEVDDAKAHEAMYDAELVRALSRRVGVVRRANAKAE